MNWVGGVRKRVRTKEEKRIQKEYFEKKRFMSQLNRVFDASPSKRRVAISQDLLSINTINHIHKTTQGKVAQGIKKVTHVDLEKVFDPFINYRKPERNLELPMSPIETPSTLELQEHQVPRVLKPGHSCGDISLENTPTKSFFHKSRLQVGQSVYEHERNKENLKTKPSTNLLPEQHQAPKFLQEQIIPQDTMYHNATSRPSGTKAMSAFSSPLSVPSSRDGTHRTSTPYSTINDNPCVVPNPFGGDVCGKQRMVLKEAKINRKPTFLRQQDVNNFASRDDLLSQDKPRTLGNYESHLSMMLNQTCSQIVPSADNSCISSHPAQAQYARPALLVVPEDTTAPLPYAQPNYPHKYNMEGLDATAPLYARPTSPSMLVGSDTTPLPYAQPTYPGKYNVEGLDATPVYARPTLLGDSDAIPLSYSWPNYPHTYTTGMKGLDAITPNAMPTTPGIPGGSDATPLSYARPNYTHTYTMKGLGATAPQYVQPTYPHTHNNREGLDSTALQYDKLTFSSAAGQRSMNSSSWEAVSMGDNDINSDWRSFIDSDEQKKSYQRDDDIDMDTKQLKLNSISEEVLKEVLSLDKELMKAIETQQIDYTTLDRDFSNLSSTQPSNVNEHYQECFTHNESEEFAKLCADNEANHNKKIVSKSTEELNTPNFKMDQSAVSTDELIIPHRDNKASDVQNGIQFDSTDSAKWTQSSGIDCSTQTTGAHCGTCKCLSSPSVPVATNCRQTVETLCPDLVSSQDTDSHTAIIESGVPNDCIQPEINSSGVMNEEHHIITDSHIIPFHNENTDDNKENVCLDMGLNNNATNPVGYSLRSRSK